VAVAVWNVKRPPTALSHFVTTGLDPVVHAEVQQAKIIGSNERTRLMDCRVKPGNDQEGKRAIIFENRRPCLPREKSATVASMLERRDPEPVFSAPFVSAPMRVEPAWIDYNGHLNMAYYNVLFDRAVDEVYELIGCGLAYLKETHHSCFTAEVHVRYLRELYAGDAVRVTFQLIDFDAKRLHYFEELRHAEAGWLSATSENMAVHVDMAARKTAPFPQAIAAQLARMKAAHAALPVPEGVGRRITMPGK
jgi:acyl-CoA thioester hydrolase